MALRMLDTFSGIGGFSLAARWLGGFETVQFVERDPYCRHILRKHWPDVPIHDDICTYEPAAGSADVVCGGFPCQDISTAGKQAGIKEGTRSGLFYELMRVVRLVGPRFVVLENVSAIVSGGCHIPMPSGRCLCGWDFGWGGLYHDPSTGQERMGSLLSQGGLGDDREGNGFIDVAPQPLRRIGQSEPRRHGQVGGCSPLGDHRRPGGSVSAEGSPLSTAQGRTGWDWNQAGGSPDQERPQVERITQGRGSSLLGDGERTKSERAIRISAAGMVCPSCGRSMADQPRITAYQSWLGTVLGAMAEAGYDCEWACIPASDVGACHRRDRWWCVAYAQGRRWRTGPGQGAGQARHEGPGVGDGGAGSDAANATGGRDIGSNQHTGESVQPECMGKPGMLNTPHPHHQRQQERQPAAIAGGSGWTGWGDAPRRLNPDWRSYLSEPVLRRGDDGLSGELDKIRELINEANDSESLSEADQLGRTMLRKLWSRLQSSAAPSDLRTIGGPDSVPALPYSPAHGRRNMGEGAQGRQQVHQGLRDLWQDLSGESFQAGQDLLKGLSERAGAVERFQALALTGRVDRLKALGNAVVPQVAAIPLGRVLQLHREAQRLRGF